MNTLQTTHISTMMEACNQTHFTHWQLIKPHAEVEFRSLLLILNWLNEMKHKQEMTTEQARIHIDIQKTTMRTRLMALPEVTMVESEQIINIGIDSIRKDLYKQMDWVII
jgi:hypothetical protein